MESNSGPKVRLATQAKLVDYIARRLFVQGGYHGTAGNYSSFQPEYTELLRTQVRRVLAELDKLKEGGLLP